MKCIGQFLLLSVVVIYYLCFETVKLKKIFVNAKIMILLGLLAMQLISCKTGNKEHILLKNIKIKHIPELSSASGICIYDGNIYLVGDDTPWLYKLDSKFNILDSTVISAIDTLIEGRTPKYLKADFECMEIISHEDKSEIVIISSGSLPQTRDTAYIVSLSDPEIIYSKNLRPLYEIIKQEAQIISPNEINIEGIAFSDNDAYLLHRGNVSENIIIRINRQEFISYIKQQTAPPEFDIYRFNLPGYKGVTSGFSGACLNPDKSGLIFTASIEDTQDEINDGKVLGSFIGIIPFAGLQNGYFEATLISNNGHLLEKKVEGITAILSHTKKVKSSMYTKLNIITVCDNDNGTSDIITFDLLK